MEEIKKYQVMIVDDEPTMAKLFAAVFRTDPHYCITCVPGGEECLRKLKEGYRPDLILLDIMMPRMNGYEVCAAIKGDESLAKLRVYYFSALHEAELKVKAEDTGADGYMQKGIDLFATVREIKGILTKA